MEIQSLNVNMPPQATQHTAQPGAVQSEKAVASASVPQGHVTDQQVKEAVAKVSEFVDAFSKSLQFSLDKESGKTVVKVIDRETSQVVRQFPSEEMLAISHALTRIEGLLLSKKV
jgi:flagellar protein FlaG